MVGRERNYRRWARLLGAFLHPDQDARDADVDQAARHPPATGNSFAPLWMRAHHLSRTQFGHGNIATARRRARTR